VKNTQRTKRDRVNMKGGRMTVPNTSPEAQREAIALRKANAQELKEAWSEATAAYRDREVDDVDVEDTRDPLWVIVLGVALGTAIAMGAVYGFAYLVVALCAAL
jgi:hypothetical protein